MFKELYKYRTLLKMNIKKEIRGKYKASFLGILWSFINPLLQVLIYAIVFPYLLGNRPDNYIVYLVTGIVPWTFFLTSVNKCVACVRENEGILKKVYFPRIILPISAVGAGIVNFFISCIIILLFCVLYKVGISWHIVFIPLIVLVESLLALGIGMALGAMDVYFQDLEYITNFLMNMLFYGCPIVYQLTQFESESLIFKMIRMNPMTTIINSYRAIFLYHEIPDFQALGIVFLVTLVIAFIGYSIFRKLEKSFAELL